MDIGATSHLASSPVMLHSVRNHDTTQSVIAGNGSKIPAIFLGNSFLQSGSRPLHLNNILITPQIVKNLISVHCFTTDNWCSIEFYPFGFSVKDLHSLKTLLHSNSAGDLYPVPTPPPQSSPSSSHFAFMTCSSSLWHKSLDHLNNDSLCFVISSNYLPCNKDSLHMVCSACQLGKQIKLPFFPSNTEVSQPFELVHSDIWTSPLASISGIRYYVLFLDHFTHYLWVYPLRRKSEVFSKFLHFHAFVQTQFNCHVKSFQCDNGEEYNNTEF